jgi:predicted metal-dependent hydrolase
LTKSKKTMPAFRETGAYEIATVETAAGPLMVPYEVRRSARSRRIRLTIGTHNQALLLVPPRQSVRDAVGFLRSQGDWLERHLRAALPPVTLAAHLARHPRLSGQGRDFALTLNFTVARPFLVFSEKTGEAEFRYPAGEGQEAALQTLLRKFAEQVLPPRVHELAARHGLRVRRVHVRDQGSRWGSCSTSGTLSLNWRLVLLPALLHDYVLLHELAHLTEMNHSDDFWNLLRQYDPQSDAHDRQLTRASRPLMRLGRSGA